MVTVFLKNRPTNEEILAYWKPGQRVQFRHFIHEIEDRRAANGVRHVRYGKSTLRVSQDGRPFVRHHGKNEFLTASVAIHNDQKYLYDLRIDSEYL